MQCLYGVYSIVIMFSLQEFVNILFVIVTPQSIGKNIRYFMYKYSLLYSDWYDDLSTVYLKIHAYVHSITNYEDRCIAGNQRIVRIPR